MPQRGEPVARGLGEAVVLGGELADEVGALGLRQPLGILRAIGDRPMPHQRPEQAGQGFDHEHPAPV